ncbi:MAG: threonine synthase [Gammaproteobacteria bacterium]
MRYTGLIERYRSRLPVSARTPIVSLCEGNTPLVQLRNLPQLRQREVEIHVKYEGLNPTGSFKDRGMTLAVSKAAEDGSRAIICASTGNTSAAAAAYAACAGMTAFVIIPEGKIALGKLAQAMMHGAVVLQITGNFDAGMQLVKEVAGQAPVTVVNSINPFRIQGQKTAAFEIVEALGRAPDFHCIPVGNAGNITAYWLGYTEYRAAGLASTQPRMCGYQASGAAPFMRGHGIDEPETVATAIRIGHPQSWEQAWNAQRESTGWFDELSDAEILAVQRLLAEKEGIFCEPASAVSVAGCLRDVERGRIPAGSLVACTLTGHGLKDPDVAIRQGSAPVVKLEARLGDVQRAILKHLP